MALVEALVAAAIVALVTGLFLSLLVQAGGDIGRSRARLQSLMVASAALAKARADGPNGTKSGERGGVRWVLICEPAPLHSARMDLIECTARTQGSGPLDGPIVLKSAWQAVRPEPSSPP